MIGFMRGNFNNLIIGLFVALISSGFGFFVGWEEIMECLLSTEDGSAVTEKLRIDLPFSILTEADDEITDEACTENRGSRECERELISDHRAVERASFDNHCTDSQGNTGTFDTVLFADHHSWTLARADEIELVRVPVDLPQILEEPGFASYIENAPEIFVFGLASCEGYEDARQDQINLAIERGDVLGGLIEPSRRSYRGRPRTTTPICLGVNRTSCPDGGEYRHQRPVVLMALFERSEELDLRDCLREVLAQDARLSFLAEDYDPGFSDANPRLTCR